MFPIILERDTPILDWPAYLAWPTATSVPNATTFAVRSDGILNTNYGTVQMIADTGAIGDTLAVCSGLHITGPQEGDEFTPYAISCVAASEDATVRPFLFIAESPATITSGAGGDTVSVPRMLAFGDKTTLKKDLTVVVAERTADRALCFGVGMWAHGAAAADLAGFARLSVRRLVGPGPRILDSRKL